MAAIVIVGVAVLFALSVYHIADCAVDANSPRLHIPSTLLMDELKPWEPVIFEQLEGSFHIQPIEVELETHEWDRELIRGWMTVEV